MLPVQLHGPDQMQVQVLVQVPKLLLLPEIVLLVLGNVAENKKFLCFTKINLWSHLATRERSASTYPCRSRAEAFKRTGLRESYSS